MSTFGNEVLLAAFMGVRPSFANAFGPCRRFHPISSFHLRVALGCVAKQERDSLGWVGFGRKARAVSRCGRLVRENSRCHASSLTPLLCVLRARQRREESDDVVDLCLAQGKGLDIIL